MLKISVVIPVYNVEKYLSKCLDSVIAQTLKDIEIICVDDCSTDGSLNILQQYAEKEARLKVVKRAENGGQAAARQSGIDIATGDYIGFVDSDDWVDPDFYEKMLKVAEETGAEIVANKNILIHAQEKVYPHDFPGHRTLQERVYHDPLEMINQFLCVVWNKLYKADFLKKRQYTIPIRNAHEDVFFHLATFSFAQTVAFFNGSAYHYLFREESISNKTHDVGLEHIKVYSQIYDFCKEHDLLDKKIKLYSTMPPFCIHNEESYQAYKSYFDKAIGYMRANAEVFNDLDLYFANSVANSKSYKEYAKTYPASATISYLRRKK